METWGGEEGGIDRGVRRGVGLWGGGVLKLLEVGREPTEPLPRRRVFFPGQALPLVLTPVFHHYNHHSLLALLSSSFSSSTLPSLSRPPCQTPAPPSPRFAKRHTTKSPSVSAVNGASSLLPLSLTTQLTPPYSSNMLYPHEDRLNNVLLYRCRTCQATESATNYCVFRNVLGGSSGETAGVITDIGSDPTLPRSNKACPYCYETEAVFFQSQQRTEDTKMVGGFFLFFCFFFLKGGGLTGVEIVSCVLHLWEDS